MQEGHFDSEGNYFIKKDQEIRDNWLDNIDWVRHSRAGPYDGLYCLDDLWIHMKLHRLHLSVAKHT